MQTIRRTDSLATHIRCFCSATYTARSGVWGAAQVRLSPAALGHDDDLLPPTIARCTSLPVSSLVK
jgi:hypothetical protein